MTRARGLRSSSPWSPGPSLALVLSLTAACSGEAAVPADEPATLVSVEPASGSARGGDTVVLAGTGLQTGMRAFVGDVELSELEVLSATEARGITAPLVAGVHDVELRLSGASALLLPSGFEALPLDLRFVEAPPTMNAPGEGEVSAGAVADFDGDGDADVVLAALGGPLRLFVNDGRGNLAEPPTGDGAPPRPPFPVEPRPTRALAAADFDGDGFVDLFAAGAAAPPAVYKNRQGAFDDVSASALPVPGAEAPDDGSALAVGDVDGDGDPDVLLGAAAEGVAALRIYDNRSGSSLRFEPWVAERLPAFAADAAATPVRALALGDIDGDDDLDLVLATPGAADGISLRVLLNDGPDGFVVGAALPAPKSAPSGLSLGDVDGDGDLDVVVVCEGGQDRLLINEDGVFFDDTVRSMPFDLVDGAAAAFADLDRDGDLDMVIANRGAQSRLYLNDGLGRFADHTPALPLVVDLAVGVALVDIDDDPDVDIIVINGGDQPSRLLLSVEPSPHDR